MAGYANRKAERPQDSYKEMKHKEIWGYINNVLEAFFYDFKRDKSYHWFVIVIIGLMVRTEHAGVTSIIRDLCLEPSKYESFLLFFRANSWKLSVLVQRWQEIMASSGLLFKEGTYVILIGDGTKEAKCGKKMPGVKKMHQESEDPTKAHYIFGHLYGSIGILIEKAGKMFCTPVTISIQDGVSVIRKWEDKTYEEVSHVVQMIKDACLCTKTVGDSILLLDRYYLSVPALRTLTAFLPVNRTIHLITRAKKSATAYFKPIPLEKPKRGRPRKKGEKVKLVEYFNDLSGFTSATLPLYGEKRAVKYFCIDLLWGLGLYQELRFVLVCYKDVKAILVSTNLAFTPEQIIRLYGFRQKIEVSFFSLKQVVHGLSSHFWSKSMPALNRYRKKGDLDPLLSVDNPDDRKNIIAALKAIEGFAFFSCIAIGILQMVSLTFHDVTNPRFIRWLRTYSNNVSSEASISVFLRNSLFSLFQNLHGFYIFDIIREKQMNNDVDFAQDAS